MALPPLESVASPSFFRDSVYLALEVDSKSLRIVKAKDAAIFIIF